MYDFKNQVVIVTGAGNGIGKQAALTLADYGAKVVVNDISEEDLNSTVGEINNNNGEAIGVKGNVADYADAVSLIETAKDNFGTVNILVNNAGITRPSMIHKMDEQQWDSVVDVSLKGTFNCIKAVAPIFIERGKGNPYALSNGKIINVTSTAGLTGTIGQVNYSAAKAGIVGVTMSTAREWGRYRIQSNAVAFGVVETDMTETIRSEKFAEKYKSKIVLNRFATKEDVVPGIVFLASSGSNYITGDVMNLSGGSHIGY